MNNFVYSQNQNQAEVEGITKIEDKTSACVIGGGVTIPNFHRDLCIHQMDIETFNQKYNWSDYLIIKPNLNVIGKGLDDKLRNCRIYINHRNNRYTLNLGEDDDNKDIFYKIPQNVQFVIIRDGKEIFAAIQEYNEEMHIYKLGNDVNMELYFETALYKGHFNSFYGYMFREPKYDFYSCTITADPQIGETLFRSFARTVNYEREEALEQQAKNI